MNLNGIFGIVVVVLAVVFVLWLVGVISLSPIG